MKHVPIQTREQLVSYWRTQKPKREDCHSWSQWMDARGRWVIDMSHALERFDRRERWARERVFG